MKSIIKISLILLLSVKVNYACEILVSNRTDTNENKGQYVKYDPVVVKPNGWNWGNMEMDKSLFMLIKIPNVSVEEVFYIMEPNTTKRRKCKVYINKLTQSETNDLEADGMLTLPDYDLEDFEDLIKLK